MLLGAARPVESGLEDLLGLGVATGDHPFGNDDAVVLGQHISRWPEKGCRQLAQSPPACLLGTHSPGQLAVLAAGALTT